MDKIIKSFLRKAIAAAFVVAFFFLQGQTAYPLWVPVAVAAFVAFAFEVFTIKDPTLIALAYFVIAFGSFMFFGGGIWAMAGVFAYPLTHNVLVGLIDLLHNGKPEPAAKA